MDTNARNVLRTSLLAALVAGSFSIASRPARADSVTPERALLGRVDAPVGASVAPKSFAASTDEETPWIDGQGALLNRRSIGPDRSDMISGEPAASHAAVPAAGAREGAEALLSHAI